MITGAAMGLSCPEPVMMAKKAVKDNPAEPVQVMVDNATARDNIVRMSRGVKRTATVQEQGDAFVITLDPQ